MAALEKLISQELEAQKIYDVEEEKSFGSLPAFSFQPPLNVDGMTIERLLCTSQLDANKFKVQTALGEGPFLLQRVALPPFQSHRKIEMMIKVWSAHPLSAHENILRILAIQLNQEKSTLDILHEFVDGNCLEDIVEQAGQVSLNQAIYYLKAAASGLAHLHANGICHRALGLDNILVNKKNVKVGGYLTTRALAEDDESILQAPECRSRPSFGSPAADIWSLGVCLLHMIFGKDVSLNATEELPIEPLRDLCSRMLAKDPSKRPSPTEIRDFFIPSIGVNIIPLLPETTSPPPKPANSTSQSASRYHSDFEELEFVGRGGFGSVVKARNKIDNLVYAIKKVPLDPQNVENNKKILREVTTLSRMHHERVIRYYQAWIETEGVQEAKAGDASNEFTFSTNPIDLSFSSSSSSSEEDYSDIVFEGASQTTSLAQSSDNKFFGSTTSTNFSADFTESTVSSPITTSPKQFLYIQMEFCPNQGLRDLLDERAENGANAMHVLDPSELWRLFRQILEGLAHIHAQGMMHRDLKPSNIFLDSNGDIKIGDFGLAVTKGENQETDALKSLKESALESSLTTNIGTPFYVSPEQYQQGSQRYNQKVDMYALGIILVELWCPFSTGMERVKILHDCRLPLPKLPSSLPAAVSKIVSKLLDHDPKKRFSSFELLKSDLLPPMLEADLLDDAVRTVAQPGTPQYPRLISTIFARQHEQPLASRQPKDFAFDVRSSNVNDLVTLERLSILQSQLERVFQAHDAICVHPPLVLIPLSDLHSNNYRFVDETGQLLELPSDLTRPFARMIAQSNIHSLRRFVFDRTFAKAHAHFPGGQPSQQLHASFDIVSPHRHSDSIAVLEAFEVIKCALDVCSASFRPESLVLKLGHPSLPPIDRNQAKQTAEQLKKQGVPESFISLYSILQAKQTKIRLQLEQAIPNPIYSGTQFQVLHEGGRKGRQEVLVSGGDYSQLVEEYRFPTSRLESPGPVAFGASFNLINLTKISTPSATTHQVALLVPDELSDECTSLFLELLKCCSVRLFAESEEAALLRQVKSFSVSHVLQVRRSLVRIKNVTSGRQFDVPVNEVISVLDRDEGHEPSYVQVNESNTETATESPPEQEFHFVLSGAKHQRTLLREKATKSLLSLKDCTVIIHEIPRELLLSVIDGKVAAWRDAEELDLAHKLLALLKKLAVEKKPTKPVCFYNHRDSSIMKIPKK